jgi:hypothetical protein
MANPTSLPHRIPILKRIARYLRLQRGVSASASAQTVYLCVCSFVYVCMFVCARLVMEGEKRSVYLDVFPHLTCTPDPLNV